MKFKNLLFYFFLFAFITQANAQNFNLLIGTYTNSGKSEGIYVYEFNSLTGKATYKNKATGIKNPSFLTLTNDNKFLYAVNELGPKEGGVASFAFDKKTGALKLLNTKPSNGNGPCYVAVNKKKNHIFAANYMSGSVSAIPLLKDGSFGEGAQTDTFKANGLGKGQQSSPHAHSTVLSPDGNYLYVSDLGNDEIVVYKYSPKASTPLVKTDIIKLPAGSGPRHFEFHPNKKFGYSVEELTGDIYAYSYKKGKLTFLQNVSGLPEGFKGRRWSADIHVSPDGKFLYSSNRDDLNDISVFSIHENGKLTLIGRHSTLGKVPRNFAIDPSGNYLLVANQNSDSVIILKRDKTTGLLSDTGDKLEIGTPVCLKFGEID